MKAVGGSIRLVLFLVGVLVSAGVTAQAHYALRDPATTIFSLVPEADSYRSIVRAVDARAREVVATRLPVRLHFNELDNQTLYVASSGDREMALVQARSEPGRWGLVEIAWSMDVNLRIRDFTFLRCRDPLRQGLETEHFRQQLRGLSFSELRRLLTIEADALRPDALQVPAGSHQLALLLIRSALKTMAFTETVWREDVERMQLAANARALWPGLGAIEEIPDPYSERVQADLAEAGLEYAASMNRSSLKMYRVIDPDGAPLGAMVQGHWLSPSLDTWLLWLVRADGTVQAVRTHDGWATPALAKAFDGLAGFGPRPAESCTSTAELAALEVSLLTRLNTGME